MSEKESLEKLLVYQQDLQAEEECLKNLIDKIDKQARALQVEQLNILSAINRNTNSNTISNETKNKEVNFKNEIIDPERQELDLRVPTYQSSEEDDDEMED